MDNVPTLHRDALLLGFFASAKGREAKGLARLALAHYLGRKAQFTAGPRKFQGRQKVRLQGFVEDDGKVVTKEIEQSDEEYAHTLHLTLYNSDAVRREAERLYAEVIAEYGDVPYLAIKHRELEALLKEPAPTWNGKPLTEAGRRRIETTLARKKTLAEVAEARLDAMNNLVAGKPAPEIEGVGLDGKPLKLSNYRGKVVVLVFWGSWCGPCMREMPHERELVKRLEGRPFALLGINCDRDQDAARKAMAEAKITWPNWYDGAPGEGPIAGRYHIRGYPSVFVLDADGVIRHQTVLGEGLDKAVDTLLAELEAKNPRK
ncbi:MAG: TlpA disulfide reductase family protein [Singulisphaera sp.]